MGGVYVTDDKTSITLADIVTASGSTASVYSKSDFAAGKDAPVALAPGADTHVYIEVTAEDGATTAYYDVTVNRAAPPAPPAPPAGNADTDITAGGVQVIDGATGKEVGGGYTLSQQGDGSWLISVPNGTNLKNLKLIFTLPDGASIMPDDSTGAGHDFSDDAKTPFEGYIVTASDGHSTGTYKVRVREKAAPADVITTSELVSGDASKWKLDSKKAADGSYPFTLEAELNDPTSAGGDLGAIAVDMGAASSKASYAVVEHDGKRWLRITATAKSMDDLKKFSIKSVEWTKDGAEYRQDFNPTITYDSIPDANKTVDTGSSDGGGGGGGCATGAFGVLGAAAAFAARKRRARKS
jgi:hypothetical protein